MLLNLLPEIQLGNIKSLARCISAIENQDPGSALVVKKASRFQNTGYWFYRTTGCRKEYSCEWPDRERLLNNIKRLPFFVLIRPLLSITVHFSATVSG